MNTTSNITGVIHVNGIHTEIELINLYRSLLLESYQLEDVANMSFMYKVPFYQNSSEMPKTTDIKSIVWSGTGSSTGSEYARIIFAYLDQLHLLRDIESASILVTDNLSKVSTHIAYSCGVTTSTKIDSPQIERQNIRSRSRFPTTSKTTKLSSASKSKLTKDIEAQNKRMLDYIKNRRGY